MRSTFYSHREIVVQHLLATDTELCFSNIYTALNFPNLAVESFRLFTSNGTKRKTTLLFWFRKKVL